MSDEVPIEAPGAGHPGSTAAAAPVAMTGQVTLGNGQVRTLASPGKRLVARIIDIVLLVVVMIIIGTLGIGGTAALGSSGSDAGIGAAIAAMFMTVLTMIVLTILYEVTLVALKGQTVGKMAVGIRVARADTGTVPGWGKSIIRWALPNLMCLIPLIGWLVGLLTYVSLTWDDRRQGWHDKAAATVVVD